MKIGAMVESFRAGFRGGVEKAASLGVAGVQVYATRGELAVDDMTPVKAKEALDIVRSNGLVFPALCGDFGVGFTNPEKNKIYVEKSKRIVDLALELDCKVVTTHIGTVPAEENETKKIMRDEYFLNQPKASLVVSVANAESKIIKKAPKNACSLYVSIPFCPTRCSYCSFVSYTTPRLLSMIDEYLDAMIEEMNYTFDMAGDSDVGN